MGRNWAANNGGKAGKRGTGLALLGGSAGILAEGRRSALLPEVRRRRPERPATAAASASRPIRRAASEEALSAESAASAPVPARLKARPPRSQPPRPPAQRPPRRRGRPGRLRPRPSRLLALGSGPGAHGGPGESWSPPPLPGGAAHLGQLLSADGAVADPAERPHPHGAPVADGMLAAAQGHHLQLAAAQDAAARALRATRLRRRRSRHDAPQPDSTRLPDGHAAPPLLRPTRPCAQPSNHPSPAQRWKPRAPPRAGPQSRTATPLKEGASQSLPGSSLISFFLSLSSAPPGGSTGSLGIWQQFVVALPKTSRREGRLCIPRALNQTLLYSGAAPGFPRNAPSREIS